MDAIWSQADEKRFSKTLNIDFSINSEKPIIPKKAQPKKTIFSFQVGKYSSDSQRRGLQLAPKMCRTQQSRHDQVQSS